jgi:hypothetical protein
MAWRGVRGRTTNQPNVKSEVLRERERGKEEKSYQPLHRVKVTKKQSYEHADRTRVVRAIERYVLNRRGGVREGGRGRYALAIYTMAELIHTYSRE